MGAADHGSSRRLGRATTPPDAGAQLPTPPPPSNAEASPSKAALLGDYGAEGVGFASPSSGADVELGLGTGGKARSRPAPLFRLRPDVGASGEFVIGAFRGAARKAEDPKDLPARLPTPDVEAGRRGAAAPRAGRRHVHVAPDAASRRHRAALPAPRAATPRCAGAGVKPYEVTALEERLARMQKLQLGPLTLAADVAPVLDCWERLVALRARHGRRAVAGAWLRLANATALVARRMALDDASAVVEALAALANPGSRALRLPAGLLLALADRCGAGGALRAADDAAALRLCRAAGALLRVASMHEGGAADLAPVERALERMAAAAPLVRAALADVARRAQLAVFAGDAGDAVGAALFVAEALAHLAGGVLALPAAWADKAYAGAAAEDSAAAAAQRAASWWQRTLGALGPAAGEPSATQRARALLPALQGGGADAGEALRLAGDAAECLSHDLAPAAVARMLPPQLAQFATALADATDADAGLASADPLRRALGLALGEAALRAETGTLQARRKDVRALVEAARARLLGAAVSPEAPAGGVARALAALKGWLGESSKAKRTSLEAA